MSEHDLVIVHHGANRAEAEVVRTVLENNGISAIVPDANNPYPGIDTTPFDGETGISGCEVAVAAADADRAREVIAEAKASGGGAGDDN